MITLKGQGISSGYAAGTLRFFQNGNDKFSGGKNGNVKLNTDPKGEAERFDEAKKQAVKELELLSAKLGQEGLEEASLLMETLALLADDPDYEDSIKAHISDDGYSAEESVRLAGEEFAALFEQMSSDDMKARAADILDVSKRITGLLEGSQNQIRLKEKCIASAEEFSPSMLASLDRNMLLAIISSKGTTLGHMAIIAKSFGIPAITNIEDLSADYDGKTVIADGYNEELIIDPDEATLSKYKDLIIKEKEAEEDFAKYFGLPDETKTGKKIKLYCNIQTPDDADAVLENDGRGIGLFRSEFIFLGRNSAPSEEEQFEAYKKVLLKMEDREVIIRTMDIGADKDVSYLKTQDADGYDARGIRLSLNNPQILKTQLRALYRASAFGNLSIMFPMVSELWELEKAKEFCQEVIRELTEEGCKIKADLAVGIMIETPKAVSLSTELAKEADFFSIGTNDLTYYTLGLDRFGADTKERPNQKDPKVLELIDLTIKNAHREGIPVGICGELASDPEAAKLLIDMGIDELSVTPNSVLKIRKAIVI